MVNADGGAGPVVEGRVRRARRVEDKEVRGRTILDATRQLLVDVELDDITMSDVARAAGLAKGTTYLYFATKEELVLALLTRELDDWFRVVDQALAELSDADASSVAWLIADSLANRPLLTRLLGILHTVLERNVRLEVARAFKQQLSERICRTGATLESTLPFLEKGDGFRLLMRIDALAIGLHHMTHHSRVVAEVLTDPQLCALNMDFRTELAASVRSLVHGIEHESGTLRP